MMTTNNTADNPIFVFMTSKAAAKMYWKRLKKYYSALDLLFLEEEIDRVHKISNEQKDKNSGKKS